MHIINLPDKSPGSTEDKIPELICENGTKKNTPIGHNSTAALNRGKKRKRAMRDATAPKQPLTGYFRYHHYSSNDM